MTFWAARVKDSPQHVDVHTTYGPVTVTVREHIGHLRSFWGELGRVLDEAEKPAEDAS